MPKPANPFCKKCGEEKTGSYVKESMCAPCMSAYRKEKRLLKRVEQGKNPWSGSGRSPLCSKCGVEKDEQHLSSGYCRACKAEASRQKRAKLREESGLRPIGSGPSPICRCGAAKESPKSRECNECHRKRDNEWRLKTGRTLRHRTGLCRCGEPFAPYSKCYCTACASKWRKEYLSTHPEQKDKIKVRTLTNFCIRNGLLTRNPCEVCGELKVDAHHDDYMRPLDVRWLCRKHHNEHHRNLELKEP